MSVPSGKIANRAPRPRAARLEAVAAVREAWPDDVANTLARRVAWYRHLRELSQEALAERAGLSASAVCDAESGQSHMDVRTLVTLAAALGTTAGTLLGEVARAPEALAADEKRRAF